MSTPSTISIVTENGKVDTIYCHWDGYVSNMGKMLLEHYNSKEKAKSIIDNGYASSISEKIAPSTDTHSFSTPEKGVCVFYHRDRGDLLEIDTFSSISQMLNKVGQSHNYIFYGEKWYYCKDYDIFNTMLIPLELAIKRDEVESL